jgi:hypothetical protein
LSAPVNVIAEFIGFVPANRCDGIVGANHIAHRTAHTLVSRIGFLPDPVIGLINAGRGIHKPYGRLQISFAKHPEFYGVNRADRRAFAAKGTGVFIPNNLPRQIFDT